MHRGLIVLLRVLLCVIVAGCLVAQIVVLPLGAPELARELPEVGGLAPLYVAAAIAAIACLEVAIGATWLLLTRVARREIFSRAALRHVDVIIVCAAVAAALTAAVLAHLMVVAAFGPPGILLVLAAVLVGCTTLAVLVTVMRGLLVAATDLESELAAVV